MRSGEEKTKEQQRSSARGVERWPSTIAQTHALPVAGLIFHLYLLWQNRATEPRNQGIFSCCSLSLHQIRVCLSKKKIRVCLSKKKSVSAYRSRSKQKSNPFMYAQLLFHVLRINFMVWSQFFFLHLPTLICVVMINFEVSLL